MPFRHQFSLFFHGKLSERTCLRSNVQALCSVYTHRILMMTNSTINWQHNYLVLNQISTNKHYYMSVTNTIRMEKYEMWSLSLSVCARKKMKIQFIEREKMFFSGFFSIDHQNRRDECEMSKLRETNPNKTLMTPFNGIRWI